MITIACSLIINLNDDGDDDNVLIGLIGSIYCDCSRKKVLDR